MTSLAKAANMMVHRFYAWLRDRQGLLLLLAALGVFRLLSILVLRPGGFIAPNGPDQGFDFEMGRLSGSGNIPFRDFWVEYPPVMPWLATLLYQLNIHLPPWSNYLFWFNTLFKLVLIPCDLAVCALIYGCVRKLAAGADGDRRGLQAASLWALVFAPFFALLAWFEPLMLFFLVLALYGLLTDRPALAGAAIGLGFATKVFTIVLLPIGLFTLQNNRRRLHYLLAAALGVGAILGPALLLSPTYTLAWFRTLQTRSSWSTVWALLEGFTGYGLVAPLAGRNDPATATFAAHPSTLPWWPIALVFAALYLLVITRHIAWRDPRRVALFALFSLVLFVLYNKGYSPQWATYLSTLALVALPVGIGLGYALLLSLTMVAEWPIAFFLLADQPQVLAAVILVRTLVLVCLAADAVARMLADTRAWRLVRRGAPSIALATSLIVPLVMAPSIWRGYRASRLDAEPLKEWIVSQQHPEPRAGPIVIVQPELLERLRPYLPGRDIALFPNVNAVAWAEVVPWLDAATAGRDRAWFLYDNQEGKRRDLSAQLRQALGSRGGLVSQAWIGKVWVGEYVTTPPGAEGRPLRVLYEQGLTLEQASVSPAGLRPGDAFTERLTFLPGAALSGDRVVSVQLLSAEGRVVAQSDLAPEPPSSKWVPGQQVRTQHGLILPADLAPGTYRLQVSLYDPATLKRLALRDGGDAVGLGEIMVGGN